MTSELQKLVDCKVELNLMPYQAEVIKSLIREEILRLEYHLKGGTDPNLTGEERSKMIIEYHRIYNMIEDATRR